MHATPGALNHILLTYTPTPTWAVTHTPFTHQIHKPNSHTSLTRLYLICIYIELN